VLHNGNRKAVEVELPAGNWTTVVHDTKINLDGLEVINTTKFILTPSSSTIMYEK
jgi:hypothetical protein